MMKKLVLATMVLNVSLFATSGEDIAKENGCMDCHNVMGQNLAPAFMGTARKNIRWFGSDAKSKIMASIKNGSKAKYRNFSNTEMPAYAHLSSSELNTIASWILAEYEKNRALRQNPNNQRPKGQGR